MERCTRAWKAKRKWYVDHGVVEYPATGDEMLVTSVA
jgi:hypothetical protein